MLHVLRVGRSRTERAGLRPGPNGLHEVMVRVVMVLVMVTQGMLMMLVMVVLVLTMIPMMMTVG